MGLARVYVTGYRIQAEDTTIELASESLDGIPKKSQHCVVRTKMNFSPLLVDAAKVVASTVGVQDAVHLVHLGRTR